MARKQTLAGPPWVLAGLLLGVIWVAVLTLPASAQTETAAPTATAAPTECLGEPDDPPACRPGEGVPENPDDAVPVGGVDTGAGGTAASRGIEAVLLVALAAGLVLSLTGLLSRRARR